MKIATIFLALILLWGCAAPSPHTDHDLLYHAYRSHLHRQGGYTDRQWGDATFEITYKGSGYESREIIYQFALRRASELVLERGMNYFTVMDKRNCDRLDAISGCVVPGVSLTIKGSTEKPAIETYWTACEVLDTMKREHDEAVMKDAEWRSQFPF